MPESNHRRKLNTGQIEVLELLHKFRFGSSELIAQYFDKKSGVFAYNRLKRLHEQGYIGKRFDSSYRIQGKPAAYFLLPDGARVLQTLQQPDDDPINIKAIYKDKTLQEPFVERCLDIFAIHNGLKSSYGDSLSFFTRVNLNYEGYGHFPDPLPDAFIVIELENGNEKEFFLDLYSKSEPFFVAVRKIEKYIKYARSGNWFEETSSPMPVILAVSDSLAMQKRLRKRIDTTLRKNQDVDIAFLLCSKEDVAAHESTIWQRTDSPDARVALNQI